MPHKDPAVRAAYLRAACRRMAEAVTVKQAAAVAGLTLLLAGLLWVAWRERKATEAKVAAQAAITKAAEARADSLAVATKRADERAAADSTAAVLAKARAARAEAASTAALEANRTLRARITLLGDTTVIVDSGPPQAIPAAVARQLRSDDSTIAALQVALTTKDSAFAAQERLAESYKGARDSAEVEVASLRTANAALHAQVKLLAPPKCGHVCSGVVGAGAALLLTAGIRRL